MKKLLIIFLTMILTFSLTACKTKNDEELSNNQNTTNQTPQNLDDWGMLDAKTVRSKNDTKQIFFRWPVNEGKDAYTAKIEGQNDGTIAMVDNYVPGYSPEVDSMDQVFPAYFEQTVKSFEKFYKGNYSDGSFTIEQTETVTLNDHEFYKYHGKHNYSYEGEASSSQYVIYLTTMKLNGAYLYFLVSDVTDDQSATAKMEENAYNMVLSFQEED